MSSPFQMRSLLAEFGRRLYERNHIGAAEGNLSARLADGRLMITPSGANKGFMKADEMIICDSAGKKLQGAGRPSSEIKLHAAIYGWRPEIMAICHAHPVYATAYSTARIPLMRPVLAEVVGTVGGVPLARYGAPGTSDLPGALEGMVDRYDVFLLESHGVLSLGKSLEDAFNKIETVERFAAILYIAEKLGEVKELPAREIERLLKAAGRLNIKEEIMAHVRPAVEKPQTGRPAEPEKESGTAGYR